MKKQDIRFISTAVIASLGIGFLAGCQVVRPNDGASALARGQAAFSACVAEQCDRLNLDGSRLSDYRYLGDLTHVRALMISWTNFSEISDITEMTQLTELHIGGTQVTDISGIGAFANLRVLHIQTSQVSDFSPMAELQSLEELAMRGTAEQVAILAELPGLQRLSLEEADHISGLRGHPGLRSLDMPLGWREEGLDFSVFATMPALQQLNILTYSDRRLTEAELAQIEALRAAGIEVNEDVVAVVVC